MVGLIEIGGKLIDKFFPDKAEADKAKAELVRAQQAGEFKELEARTSIITAEAQSKHKLTSMARPMFLYVMYIMILASLPAAGFYIWYPDETKLAIAGMRLWLDSIPQDMWILFGVGFMGYTANRSADKARQLGQDPGKGLLSKFFG